MKPARRPRTRIPHWPKEAEARFAIDYPDTPNCVLVRRYGRPLGSIYHKANELGVHKSRRLITGMARTCRRGLSQEHFAELADICAVLRAGECQDALRRIDALLGTNSTHQKEKAV